MNDDEAALVSDMEYSMIILVHGFLRWVGRCAEASGISNVTALDILVLHAVNHRARNKKLAEICLVLNIEDNHTVAYALKKLEERGLVDHEQKGRDRAYFSTKDGDNICKAYRHTKSESLITTLKNNDFDFETLPNIGAQMNRLVRAYSEAERSATIISSEKSLLK